MKVSFIVPVYKIADYIPICVESLLKQTYKDFEIILVDDGSPDNCPQICDNLAADDERIKVLHKVNGGLSDARNEGTKIAQGEYIVYVDGDDFWIHDDDLQKLVDLTIKYPQADFIGFNCSYYYPDSNSYVPWELYDESLAKPTEKSEAIIKLTSTSSFVMSAWMKIFKRAFIQDNELFFKKGQLSEDIQWFINVLDKSTYCMFVNQNVYAYRQGVAGSITRNVGLKHINDLIGILVEEVNKIEDRSFTADAKECVLSFLAYEYSIILGYLQYLDKEEAERKFALLKDYEWLLTFTQDPKVKKVALAKRFLGLRLTAKLLQARIRRMRK